MIINLKILIKERKDFVGEVQINQLIEYLSQQKSKKVILHYYSDLKRLTQHQMLALTGAIKHDNRVGVTYLQNGKQVSKVVYLREMVV